MEFCELADLADLAVAVAVAVAGTGAGGEGAGASSSSSLDTSSFFLLLRLEERLWDEAVVATTAARVDLRRVLGWGSMGISGGESVAVAVTLVAGFPGEDSLVTFSLELVDGSVDSWVPLALHLPFLCSFSGSSSGSFSAFISALFCCCFSSSALEIKFCLYRTRRVNMLNRILLICCDIWAVLIFVFST